MCADFVMTVLFASLMSHLQYSSSLESEMQQVKIEQLASGGHELDA